MISKMSDKDYCKHDRCVGCCDQCKIEQLQAENKNLSMIIKAIEEWAVVDFNNDLLAFIKESKKMSADEIEQALQGKKRD
jgi:hypothetical protein